MGIMAGQTGGCFRVRVGFDLGHVFFVMTFETERIAGAGQEKSLG